MATKLMMPVDFSPYTEKLLGCAGELKQVGMAEVVMLHVVASKEHAEYGDHRNPAHVEDSKKAAELLDNLAAPLEEQGLVIEKLIKTGNPVSEILETASEEMVDLIFLGAQGKGFLHRTVLGSVSDRVLRLSDRPVMVQKCRVERGKGGYTCENVCSTLFGNILVANDFSNYSEKVEPILLDFAKTFCTPMTLLHVREGKVDGGYQLVDEIEKEKIKDKMEHLQDLSYQLGDYCKNVRIDIVNGSPPSAILSYAEEMGATMIIMGAFGHQGVVDTLLGSVTEKVIRKSDIPVLVLKERGLKIGY